MQDMLNVAWELGLLPPSLPGSPAASPPSSPGASQPSWLRPLTGAATPPPDQCQMGSSEQLCQQSGEPDPELLSLFSGCFELPFLELPLSHDGPPAAGPAEAAGELWTPPQQAQLPAAQLRAAQQPQLLPAAQAPVVPLGTQTAQQQQQRRRRKKGKGRKGRRKQAAQLHEVAHTSSRKPAASPARSPPPCTRAAARAAATHRAAAAAATARQPRQPLPAKAVQAIAAGLLAELPRRLLACCSDETAGQQREQRRLLEASHAQQLRQLEAQQQAQLLQLQQQAQALATERAQLLAMQGAQQVWRPRPAAERPAAGLLPSCPPQPTVAAGQPQLWTQQPVQQHLPLDAQPLLRQRQPPLLRSLSAPVQWQQQRLPPPSSLQRALSVQLQQQQERLAQQRAEQQQWAEAAVRLVGRTGSKLQLPW